MVLAAVGIQFLTPLPSLRVTACSLIPTREANSEVVKVAVIGLTDYSDTERALLRREVLGLAFTDAKQEPSRFIAFFVFGLGTGAAFRFLFSAYLACGGENVRHGLNIRCIAEPVN